jgi:uncharacterized protein (TIGR00255 family)
MIRSMTAYAGAELTRSQIRVEIEIRGYNSRNLDMAVKMPPGYPYLEEKIRSVVAGRISRGRIEIRLSIQFEAGAEEAFQINEAIADGYYAALERLARRFQISAEIPLNLLAAKSGIIEPAQPEMDAETTWQAVSEALCQALDTFTEMKITEGRHTAQDLEKRIAAIEDAIREIEQRASGLLDIYQQRLKERIHSLTQGMTDIDEARIAQETAILADKSDISEEINRSRSHLNQFRQLMDARDPAGRPLNFLLQEFNREFNTMGSKIGSAEISHIIVSAKTELEKIREQVQNIE